jgi:N-acetylmuramic acid 6-phosphate etherase
MLTEQRNPNTIEIDRMTTLEALTVMNREDATVAGVVQAALPQIAAAVDLIVAKLRAGGRLFYVGAGTSGRLGVLDAAECIPTFNTDPETVQGLIAGGERAMRRAVEGAEDDEALARSDLAQCNLTDDDVIVGIAASGRTPYVRSALAYAGEVGAGTVAISCNADGPILGQAECPIPLPVGPEVITGSTRLKAGTSQKMVLNMLSTISMVQLGKVYGNLMVDVQPTNGKLVQRAQRMVAEIVGCDDDTAAHLLTASGDHVKTAVIMGLLGVDRETARARLTHTHGHLRPVLEANADT